MTRERIDLPRHEPDAARAARVRERCKALLVQRPDRARRDRLAPVLLAAFSLCYLVAIIRDVVQLHIR